LTSVSCPSALLCTVLDRCEAGAYKHSGVRVASPARVGLRRRTRLATVTLAGDKRAFFTFSCVDGGPCVPHFLVPRGLLVCPPGAHRVASAACGCARPALAGSALQALAGGHPAVTPVRATLR
jgi:hypothetical protein